MDLTSPLSDCELNSVRAICELNPGRGAPGTGTFVQYQFAKVSRCGFLPFDHYYGKTHPPVLNPASPNAETIYSTSHGQVTIPAGNFTDTASPPNSFSWQAFTTTYDSTIDPDSGHYSRVIVFFNTDTNQSETNTYSYDSVGLTINEEMVTGVAVNAFRTSPADPPAVVTTSSGMGFNYFDNVSPTAIDISTDYDIGGQIPGPYGPQTEGPYTLGQIDWQITLSGPISWKHYLLSSAASLKSVPLNFSGNFTQTTIQIIAALGIGTTQGGVAPIPAPLVVAVRSLLYTSSKIQSYGFYSYDANSGQYSQQTAPSGLPTRSGYFIFDPTGDTPQTADWENVDLPGIIGYSLTDITLKNWILFATTMKGYVWPAQVPFLP